MVQWVKKLTVAAWVAAKAWVHPLLAQWVKRSGVATAAAQIQALAWELSYAASVAVKKKEKKKIVEEILLQKISRQVFIRLLIT